MRYKSLGYFLVNLIIITVIFGTMQVAVRSVYRSNANDPQVQIVEETVKSLNDGAQPQATNPNAQINLRESIAPFVIIFNLERKPTFATAALDGKIPTPPDASFAYAKANGENRFAWEADKDVRIASVLKPYKQGFVLAGKSLREIENRERELTSLILFAWAASVIMLSLAYFFLHPKRFTSA